MRSTFPHSGVLALGLNSIQAVLPSTLISQVESLLDSHRIEDAVDLADTQRAKTQGNISIDSDEACLLPFPLQCHSLLISRSLKAEELCYVYQRIGFHCLNETLFKEAGKNLLNGEIDPRLLISYYPNLRGSLFTADDIMEVFAGVAEHMPTDDSVDDISESFFPCLPFPSRRLSFLCLFRLTLTKFPLPPLTSYLSQCRTLTFLSWN
jgi:vacuolar protein sorting-associated protein 3